MCILAIFLLLQFMYAMSMTDDDLLIMTKAAMKVQRDKGLVYGEDDEINQRVDDNTEVALDFARGAVGGWQIYMKLVGAVALVLSAIFAFAGTWHVAKPLAGVMAGLLVVGGVMILFSYGSEQAVYQYLDESFASWPKTLDNAVYILIPFGAVAAIIIAARKRPGAE
jgi:hypothetical protein